MYHIDFNKPNHVHFIGIGGISMSGLAAVLLNAGYNVSGSDAKESHILDNLRKLGAVWFQKAFSIFISYFHFLETVLISKNLKLRNEIKKNAMYLKLHLFSLFLIGNIGNEFFLAIV